MTDYFELGSTPSDENCVQVLPDTDYYQEMREECYKFKKMLEKRFPIPEEIKAWFSVKTFHHEFGRYCEVCINFDDSDFQSVEFACFVEDSIPEKWNDDSILEFVPEPDGENK